jgi:lipoyl(octanoyl) transferase
LSTDIETSEAEPNKGNIDETWRQRVCEWSFNVVDEFGFDREVVSIAVNYLDRYVAKKASESEIISPLLFQRVAVTALYLAIKLHGEIDPAIGPRRKLRIATFVRLNGGRFSVDTLEVKEQKLLSSLNWKVNPPTTVTFVAVMLRLLPKWSTCGRNNVPREQIASHIFTSARCLTELSVGYSTFTFKFKPSVIAYACILCALDVSTPLPCCVRVEFLLRIDQATSLVSSRLDVQEAHWTLFHHFPTMVNLPSPRESERSSCFTQSASVSNHDEMGPTGRGQTSPVCACEDPQELSHRRKRTCPTI